MKIINTKRAKTRKTDAKVTIGSRVSLVDLSSGQHLDLQVVNSVQPGGQPDEVSSWSPVGKALWGRMVGESIYVKVPKGMLHYRILEITDDR